jgi:hypothetical protein
MQRFKGIRRPGRQAASSEFGRKYKLKKNVNLRYKQEELKEGEIQYHNYKHKMMMQSFPESLGSHYNIPGGTSAQDFF